MHDCTTRGTFVTPTSKPISRSSRYFITPPAASRPKAEPPDSTRAWIPFASATGFKSGVSREAGPPPLMSTPAGDCLSKRNTVQPVKPLVASSWPILKPPISIMSISCICFTLYHAFLLTQMLFLPFLVQLLIKQADLISPPYIQFHIYFKSI